MSIASAQSISNASSEGEENERLVAVALKYVASMGLLLEACMQFSLTCVLYFLVILSLIISPY